MESAGRTIRSATYASHFLKTTPDLYLLAQVLGHSDARVTRLYAHLLPEHQARARNAVMLAPSIGPATLDRAQRWKVMPSAVTAAGVPQ